MIFTAAVHTVFSAMVPKATHSMLAVHTFPVIGVFLITVMLGHLGCAANSGNGGAGSISSDDRRSPSEETKKQFGTIGVKTTQIKSQLKPMDVSEMPQWALEGDVEAPSLPVWCGFPIPGKAIVCLPMAAVSLIKAASSDLKETLEESEKKINELFSTEPLADTIANELVATLKKHRANAMRVEVGRATPPGQQTVPPLSDTLFGTELVDLRLSFVPTKGPPHFQLLMTIESGLRRRSDDVELAAHGLTYKSPSRSLNAWTTNDAEVFRAELRTGAKRLATELVDFLVLEYPAQIEPLMPRHGVGVRSHQPTLGWYPTFYGDQMSQDVQPHRFTYDLRISQKGAIVYERSGLTKALHKVEYSLPSCTDHDWRVKARFDLDGRMRVSRWSRSQSFKTPC